MCKKMWVESNRFFVVLLLLFVHQWEFTSLLFNDEMSPSEHILVTIQEKKKSFKGTLIKSVCSCYVFMNKKKEYWFWYGLKKFGTDQALYCLVTSMFLCVTCYLSVTLLCTVSLFSVFVSRTSCRQTSITWHDMTSSFFLPDFLSLRAINLLPWYPTKNWRLKGKRQGLPSAFSQTTFVLSSWFRLYFFVISFTLSPCI